MILGVQRGADDVRVNEQNLHLPHYKLIMPKIKKKEIGEYKCL